jgi:hypothetical protein
LATRPSESSSYENTETEDFQFVGFGRGGEKVKNRILLILLAVMLALSVGLIGCGGGEVPEVTEYNLTISSTEGGDNQCVPAIGCTCGEGTKDSGGLTVPEQCVCVEGTEVGILASPAFGYRFIGWTGDVDTVADINAASTTITMDGSYSITASFVKQYDLTISSIAGGSVTTPGEGTYTYDEGKVVSLVAQADGGYHFVNWTGDVGTIANTNAAVTSITVSSNCIITANFAADLYFQADACVALNGPASLPPEERNPCVILEILTNIVVDSVRVDLPDGGSIIVRRYAEFSPGVEGTVGLHFFTCAPGMPIAGGEYTFTGLNGAGEAIPGARNADIWVGVEPPDPPTNVRGEVTEGGILVGWDESPIIPGVFEPAAMPQLGFYQLLISRIETGEYVYGANGIPASAHLVPRDRGAFIQRSDFGLSLDEMGDGEYSLVARIFGVAPEGSAGKGAEYNNSDPGQAIIFSIQDGEITIE